MFKKSVVTAVIILVGAACVYWVVRNRQRPQEGTVRIGAILPLTGDAAQWGIPPRNGAQMAVDEINAAGGIGGRKIEFLVEDTKCDPGTAVTAYKSIRARYDVKVAMGDACSGSTLAVAPIAEKEHVVLISPASTNPKITDAGDFIFRLVPSDALRGKVFAEYLYDDVKLHSVAILYVNNEAGVGNKDTFKSRFSQLGGIVSVEEAYAQDANDVRSQLNKVKASDAQALMVVSYLKDTVIVMKQAKELDLGKSLFFQTEAVEDSNVLREAGNAAEGVTYILAAPAEGDAANTFAQAYEKQFKKKPEIYAAEGYDIIQLIAAAFTDKAFSNFTGENLRDYLYSVRERKSASGTITFDRNGDVLKPMAIKQIHNGTPTILVTKG